MRLTRTNSSMIATYSIDWVNTLTWIAVMLIATAFTAMSSYLLMQLIK